MRHRKASARRGFCKLIYQPKSFARSHKGNANEQSQISRLIMERREWAQYCACQLAGWRGAICAPSLSHEQAPQAPSLLSAPARCARLAPLGAAAAAATLGWPASLCSTGSRVRAKLTIRDNRAQTPLLARPTYQTLASLLVSWCISVKQFYSHLQFCLLPIS